MIAAWMLYALLWSLWLSVVALFVERVAVAGRGPVRAVWIAAMVGSIILPVAMHLAPRRASALTPMADATVASTVAPVVAERAPRPVRVVETGARRSAMMRIAADASRGDRPLAAAWIVLSFGLLVYIGGGCIRLAVLRRAWRPRVVDGVHLLISDDTGPALVGVVRPSIVLPAWALALEPNAFALMLRHELEHRAAGDTRLLAFAQTLLVLMPWNPVSWWQLRRLRLAIELDCDARVLRRSSDVASYGRLLLALGRGRPSMHMIGASLVDRATDLEARIRGMTQRARLTAARAIAISSLSSVAAIAVACQVPAPETTPPPATAFNRPPASASAANDSAHRESVDTLRRRLLAADSVPSRAASGGRPLERLARDSSTPQRSTPVDSAVLSRILEMFNVAIAAETARDPDVRALHEQVLDSYRYTIDSMVRAEKGLRQIYTANHPAVIEAKRRGAEAQAGLDSLLAMRSSRGDGRGKAARLSPGCSTNEWVFRSGVRVIADDSAESRGGRLLVTTQAVRQRGIGVIVKTPRARITCRSESAEIRVFGAAPFEATTVAVETSTNTTIEVVTESGRVLVAPVLLENAAKQYELTWPPRS